MSFVHRRVIVLLTLLLLCFVGCGAPSDPARSVKVPTEQEKHEAAAKAILDTYGNRKEDTKEGAKRIGDAWDNATK